MAWPGVLRLCSWDPDPVPEPLPMSSNGFLEQRVFRKYSSILMPQICRFIWLQLPLLELITCWFWIIMVTSSRTSDAVKLTKMKTPQQLKPRNEWGKHTSVTIPKRIPSWISNRWENTIHFQFYINVYNVCSDHKFLFLPELHFEASKISH